ncbi:FecR domain-containing protein [Pontibacter sp. 172403-2]|uniref:FecR family protein n=1 Tax=Pontibacter rufus TaxID=2791028 RepID=UPI0018AFD9A3|nr:FecR family protein [Pontibacter sp. 172403-2]MBF9251786.1 FecR domain-containing protein [Pontibacter sp. 172403-2]
MNADLLDRFYRGECSAEEVQALLKWFEAQNPGVEQEQELQRLWQEADPAKGEKHDAGSIFSQIKRQQHELGMLQEKEVSAVVRPIRWREPEIWLKLAAAVLLPLCFIVALVQYNSRPDTKVAEYTTVVTAPGVKKTIHLPDGSVIKLNAGSKVSYLKDFVTDKREVLLDGEAFFEVAKDKIHPFIVHTGNISTQAVGTSFNINYRLCDDVTTVALATGIVKINKQEQGQQEQQIARLVPGQLLSYNKVSKQQAVTEFNRKEVLGWKEGLLYFKGADMNQVIKKLENWYGVNIEVDGQGMQNEAWNYTGEYEDETLEKVLEGVGFVKGFTYRRTANEIKIMFN